MNGEAIRVPAFLNAFTRIRSSGCNGLARIPGVRVQSHFLVYARHPPAEIFNE